MKIIFVRHGEPDYSQDALTEKGKREAALVAERIKNWKVDEFFVSPFGRAKDTAAPTLEALGAEATTLPWLREFSYQIISPTFSETSVPWDYVPSFLYSDERLTSMDEWVDVPPMSDNEDIRENYPKVKEGIDEILLKYG